MKPIHDCPSCTCGMTEITWSDRQSYVSLSDVGEVIDAIIHCALDHSYDRGNGVPYGLPEPVRDAALPIVAKHLAAVRPDWLQNTVNLGATERDALYRDLSDAVRPLLRDAVGPLLRPLRQPR